MFQKIFIYIFYLSKMKTDANDQVQRIFAGLKPSLVTPFVTNQCEKRIRCFDKLQSNLKVMLITDY